jgi:hypothetical protein
MSIAICSSSLFNILFNSFTKLHKEKKSPKRHYLNRNNNNVDKSRIEIFSNTILKISVICILVLLYIIFQNVFTSYRNVCCLDFLQSILSEENHTIHVFKQLCFAFILLYIFKFSHVNLKSTMKNASEIIFYLFESEDETQQSKDADKRTLSELNNDAEVYRPTTYNDKKKCCSFRCLSYYILFFDKKSLLVKKIETIVLVVFFLITLFMLLFMKKIQLIHLWSISFLVMNLLIVSATLLINYFPYQVVTDFGSKKRNNRSDSFLFNTREDKSVKNQQKVATFSGMSLIKEGKEFNEEENDQVDDPKSIENAFTEHKQALKDEALSNKSLSFGINQPSMISAYKVSKFSIFD